jgi:hypothetical protein
MQTKLLVQSAAQGCANQPIEPALPQRGEENDRPAPSSAAGRLRFSCSDTAPRAVSQGRDAYVGPSAAPEFKRPTMIPKKGSSVRVAQCKETLTRSERLVMIYQTLPLISFLINARFDHDPSPLTIHNTQQFEDKRVAHARPTVWKFQQGYHLGHSMTIYARPMLARPGETFDDYVIRLVDEATNVRRGPRAKWSLMTDSMREEIRVYREDIHRVLRKAMQPHPSLTDAQLNELTRRSFGELMKPVEPWVASHQ